jgi:hypothetical protein
MVFGPLPMMLTLFLFRADTISTASSADAVSLQPLPLAQCGVRIDVLSPLLHEMQDGLAATDAPGFHVN